MLAPDGSHETLSNINLKAVQDFVRDNYRPEYTTMVVVGDFDLSEAGSLLQEAFRGSEELLMSPEDAKTFTALETENEQIKFLNKWYQESFRFQHRLPQDSMRNPCGASRSDSRKKDEFPKVKGMLDSPHLL